VTGLDALAAQLPQASPAGVVGQLQKCDAAGIEILRAALYEAYALGLARRGQFEAARAVALETVAHVTMDRAQPHFLLGQLAVSLGDQTLLREAKTFLRVFGFTEWEGKLVDVVRSGLPDYAPTR
jgi:hypothetical protein